MEENLLYSIRFKLQAAKYHYDRAQSCLYTPPSQFDDPNKQLLTLSCEITAMMLTLQSATELTRNFAKPYIRLRFKSDQLFSKSEYIRDFCNFTKHQNIIRTEQTHSLYCGDFFASSTAVNTTYFVVDEFFYKFVFRHKEIERTHPKQTIDPNFFDSHYKEIRERICEIIP